METRIARAEADGLVRNRVVVEAGGEVTRTVEIETPDDGAQRRLALELHRDGDDAVADRDAGDAERTARILRR